MKASDFLVLADLDETLFHATGGHYFGDESDFAGHGYQFYKRPYVDEFLSFVRDSGFSFGVFTAAGEDYAQFALSHLLPEGLKLSVFLHRSNVTVQRRGFDYGGLYSGGYSEPVVRKHLHKVYRRGFSRHRVVAVDDKPELYASSYGNVVPVPPFEGLADDVLLRLVPYLKHLSELESVRGPDHRKLFFG